MAVTQPVPGNDERLAMLLGFQSVDENRRSNTTFIERGKGIYVYDNEGREYIEAASSFYVAALGYQHEELIDAISAQYHELPFYTSAIQRTSSVALALAERLVELVPIDNAHILFATTGSEANDFLVKMLWFRAVANSTPQKRRIIGRHGSYAGGTLAAASLTGGHHSDFGLPLPEFSHVAQPDYHGARYPGESGAQFSDRLAEELCTLLGSEPEKSFAAMFAEPVSFYAGVAVPPAEYFQKISKVLRDHDVDLVADEVITGFGRTGSWFGSETLGFRPDHMVAGKAITAGYFPLSVIALGEALYEDLEKGSRALGTLAHAATYSAHPVGAATALKTLEILQRDGIVQAAERKGHYLKKRFEKFRDHPLIGDVRTIGLAGAIDLLRRDEHDEIVNTDCSVQVQSVFEHLLKAGVVARPTERGIQIAPPLIIEESEIDLICDRIGEALDNALRVNSHD